MINHTKRLETIYASIPKMECIGKCQQSCGAIALFPAEVKNLRNVEISLPTVDGTITCSKLSPLGTCTIYQQRPLICRLYGQVRKLRCQYGCKPERWITQDESRELTDEIQKLKAGECYVSMKGVQLIQKKQPVKAKGFG